ncbi:hypothetical protein BC835DRAFT_1386080 [Cytidiella melzeri]|nr:hypothetical protein BC835DRAFT_1386080 [Cytidiella melzeri]
MEHEYDHDVEQLVQPNDSADGAAAAESAQTERETQMVLDPQTTKKKRNAKEPQTLVHVPGKSLFPVSRIQKILKADKELPMVTREAVLLVSLATEEFVKRLAEASHRLALRENRSTVQRKDVASVCRRADEYFFLEEIIPLYEPELATKRKPKALDKAAAGGAMTALDQFVSRSKPVASGSGESPDMLDEDVVMNEDGTMTLDSL